MQRLVTAAVLLVGCSSPSPSSRSPASVVVADAGTASPAAPGEPPAARASAKWIPGQEFLDIGSGRRGAVVRGRRVVVDGAHVTLVDDKPIAGLGRPRRVPDGLGGGFVFVGSSGLWSARSFDGPLVTIVSGGNATELGFGIDQVQVKESTFELSTGKPVPPPVSNLAQLFGLPSGQVAARAKNGDAYLSTAKGKPFVPVAKGVEQIAYDGRGFVLGSRQGQQRLTLDGKVSPLGAGSPGMISSDNMMAFGDFPDVTKPVPTEPDIERVVAPLAVTMNDGHVLRVDEHDLLVFDGATGTLASTQKDAFANHENCSPLRGGTPAFVGCNDPGGMSLFRVEAVDRAPIFERSFLRAVTPDFGFPGPDSALAVGARCDGTTGSGAFCVRRDDATWSDVAVSDPQGLLARTPFLAGVLATRDGVPYGFAWLDGGGPLVMLDGKTRSVRAIPTTDLPPWATTAIRWQAVTASDGKVRFLLEGGRPGILTIDEAGAVDVRPLTGRLAAIGARGMLVSPDGNLSETIDAGRTWREVEPPPGGADPSMLRCGEGGCTVGPWRRLGWSR